MKNEGLQNSISLYHQENITTLYFMFVDTRFQFKEDKEFKELQKVKQHSNFYSKYKYFMGNQQNFTNFSVPGLVNLTIDRRKTIMQKTDKQKYL